VLHVPASGNPSLEQLQLAYPRRICLRKLVGRRRVDPVACPLSEITLTGPPPSPTQYEGRQQYKGVRTAVMSEAATY
jgi:hypothetical protein